MSMFKGAVPLGFATLLLAASAGLVAWVAATALIQLVARRTNEPRPFHRLGTDFLDRLTGFNSRLLPARYQGLLRKQLTRAGEPRDLSPAGIVLLQQAGALAGILLGWIVCRSLQVSIGWMLVAAIVGAWYPVHWLGDQVKRRQLRITRALPYHLDLLTLAVEAGLDFTGALAKAVEKGKPGPLKDEFSLVLKQLKLGKTREESLKALIQRVDLAALTTFVTALILADRMGTSLGKVLRIQSAQLRLERSQRAEKLANQAPVKMLLPLIGCIFPTVFLVLFGPIVFAFVFGEAAG
jgi:tight adherence protein C